jgi:hypothetical protein
MFCKHANLVPPHHRLEMDLRQHTPLRSSHVCNHMQYACDETHSVGVTTSVQMTAHPGHISYSHGTPRFPGLLLLPYSCLEHISNMLLSQYPRCHCDGFHFFLDLPRELRDLVYRSLVADLPSRIFISNRMPLSNLVLMPDLLPNICFVSKRLRKESVLVYLQRTRLVFDDLWSTTITSAIRPLEEFLARFDRSYECIRMLTFHEVSRFGSSRSPDALYPAKFITLCTGLQDLVIHFRFSHLIQFNDTVVARNSGDSESDSGAASDVRLLTKEELRHRWGLAGLFALQRLNSVRFCCTVARWQQDEYRLGSPEDMVRNFSDVLRGVFEAHGWSPIWSVEAILTI